MNIIMIYYKIVLYFITNSTENMIKEIQGMFIFDAIQTVTAKRYLELNNINHPDYHE